MACAELHSRCNPRGRIGIWNVLLEINRSGMAHGVHIEQSNEEKMRIVTDSWLARLAAWKLGVPQVALTLGKTVYLHRTKASHFLSNPAWVRHELKHVEQFRRHGFFRFLCLYGWESLRKGYYMNRFEVEAREAEREAGAPTL